MIEVFCVLSKSALFYPLEGVKKLKGFLRGFSTEGAQLWSLFPPHLQF